MLTEADDHLELLTRQMARRRRLPVAAWASSCAARATCTSGATPIPGGTASDAGGGAGRLAHGPVRVPRAPHAAVPLARRRTVPGRGLRRHTRPPVRVAARHLRRVRRRGLGDGRSRTCLVGASAGVPRARRRVEGARVLWRRTGKARLPAARASRRRPRGPIRALRSAAACRRCGGERRRGCGRLWLRGGRCSRPIRICRASLSPRVHACRALCRPAVPSPLRLQRRDAPGAGRRPARAGARHKASWRGARGHSAWVTRTRRGPTRTCGARRCV